MGDFSRTAAPTLFFAGSYLKRAAFFMEQMT